MGDDRQLLEEAYPGDIVSIFNPGDFRIGTTVYAKSLFSLILYLYLHRNIFKKVATKDPFKRKQLREGLAATLRRRSGSCF